MSNLRQRLLGLVTTIAILAVVIGTPLLLLAGDATPTWSDFGWTRLTSPDDGTLALAVIEVVAWLAWLVLAACLTVEAVARLRGLRPPRLPGLAVPQLAAGRLIATASLLFVALPVTTQTLASPRPEQPQDFPVALVLDPVLAAAPPTSEASSDAPASSAQRQHAPTVRYTVKRGDSLWKIAQERLGDGTRYTEIVDLNTDVLGGRPDFITPGLVLLIPDEQTGSPARSTDAETYVVEPGDTLSEIAQQTLGDSSGYPQIFTASEHTQQPDGAHLRDPDLIRPGWRLTIPGAQPAPPTPGHHEPPRSVNPPVSPPTEPSDRSTTSAPAPTPAPTPTPLPSRAPEPSVEASPEPPPGADVRDNAGNEADQDDAVVQGWVLPGLTASGALLAGALLLVLRRHRRTQLRFRWPGHVIATPPAELLPVEKTAHLTGTTTAPQIELLDGVLRALATDLAPPPPVQTVELDGERVILHLVDDVPLPDVPLPAPWTGSGATWTLAVGDAAASGETDDPAPYPLLVSVGQDAHGHLWLLNLEQPRALNLTGDADKAEALARHIAAELALNPWASLVDVDLLALAPELAPLNPLRLHHHDGHDDGHHDSHHDDGDLAFLDRLTGDLEPDGRFDHTDPDGFRVLITAGIHSDTEPVRKIVNIITRHPGRPGAAVVTLDADPAPHTVVLSLSSDGRLESDSLGLHLMASGLTAQEAAACAAIVEVTRDADIAATPTQDPVHDHANDHANGSRAAVSDAGGALRSQVTRPRPDGAAGDGSLLPLAAEEYKGASATTAEDVATLAPLAPPETRDRVEAADPSLDEDVALWRSAESPLPRLTLLGPVCARTRGDATAVAKRKPVYVELLTFLALHPSGVTSDQVAEAFGISTDRARVDLKAVRSWLGVNPRTGTDHLPNAKQSRAAKARGIFAYQVDDLLIDWDLFRRLRTRGQARGAAGIDDLTAALELVTGEPFTHLRPAGWSWLLERDRHDHIAMCAIVDVAHIVTSQALTVGDLDRARAAAETAYRAAPDDETSRLDLIQVASASGHTELAERQLIDAILNRSDDDLGPVEVPERTAKIVRQRGWDRPRHTSNH